MQDAQPAQFSHSRLGDKGENIFMYISVVIDAHCAFFF